MEKRLVLFKEIDWTQVVRESVTIVNTSTPLNTYVKIEFRLNDSTEVLEAHLPKALFQGVIDFVIDAVDYRMMKIRKHLGIHDH